MSGLLKFGLSFGEYLVKRNLKHLIAHVTNHCNFRCAHCFIDFSPKRDMDLALTWWKTPPRHFRRIGTALQPAALAASPRSA